MTSAALFDRIEALLSRRPTEMVSLGGGSVADVREIRFADRSRCVAKLAPGGGLGIEAWMLDYLRARSRLPVPTVLGSQEDLLVLEYIPTDAGPRDAGVERHAADLLADLHMLTASEFGLERDTVIGGLPQPNAECAKWLDFFRERRLLFMGRRALDSGALEAVDFARLEQVCGRLERWLDEPARPSLVHGDVWSGNVLTRGGRVAAFVDPALYYADPEVELAFATLFSTFGDEFFRRYDEHRPLAPGFFEVRRDLYNLYPLLVHSVLFGGAYAAAVRRTLAHLLD